MANAAAKKAAAAQAATATIYKPVLLGTNALYIVLLLTLDVSWTMWNILGVFLTWGLQGYAYMGILDQAANAAGNTTTTSKSSLVGGAHLDLLAVTWLVQYGTVLHTTKWYWLLLLVPVWGGWTLYTTMGGGSGSSAKNKNLKADASPTANSQATADRRQKRAERRRQKR